MSDTWSDRGNIPQEILEGAENGKHWYDAYRRVGFSHEDAMQLVCRVIVTTNVSGNSPEMSEFMSKMTMLLNRQIAEDE
jgi:hypothetical protein